ncbi:MAG: response regulator [Bacteroidales bacterium]|nr:response regulator [Bacteroidales bacterium]
MKKVINVLVVDDNVYFNSLLSKTLKQSNHTSGTQHNCRVILHSFTDSRECIRKIRSGELANNDTIAFIDYYMGNGINGAHIIKLLKEQNKDTIAVLLSQSKAVEEKTNLNHTDYVVMKDKTTPALCRLYLEQFIENKIL